MSHRFRIGREVRKHMETFGQDSKRPPEVAREEKETAKMGAADEKQEAERGGIAFASRTDVGKVRASNQDAVIECPPLWGVADGMGGHQGGETASAGAKDGLSAQLKDKEPDVETLRRAVQAINRRLYVRSQEEEKLRGMGTTLSVLWLGRKDAIIAHVGDSRVYRLRGGKLEQLTDDHSMVMELARAGMITEEQAAAHPMRNVITRAVGTESGVEVDTLVTPRQAGDVWLISSDGLHGQVTKEEICAALAMPSPDQAADRLMAAALDSGAPDNVSLVIVADREGAQ